MKRLPIFTAAAALACGPALAAIGTPVALGQMFESANASTATLTTSGSDDPVGSLTLVAVFVNNTNISGVTDSAGNSYVACPARFGDVALYYAINAADLPIGGTITLTLAASNKVNMSVVSVPGVRATSPTDICGTGVTGTGSGTISGPSTGTLNAEPELVIGVIAIASDTADTFTEAGWNPLLKATGTGAPGMIQWGYQVVTSTTSLTYSPTLGTSRTWWANVASFVGASVPLLAGAVGTRMSLTGVGH
jgi:hypothetical protein